MASWYKKIIGSGEGGCYNCLDANCLMCGGCDRPDCEKNKKYDNELDQLTNYIVDMIKSQ